MAGHPKYGCLEVFLVTGEVDEGHHLRGRSADVHPVQRPCTATDDTWKNENQYVQSAVYIQLCFALHGFRLHLKCGGCYVKVSVCKFHRADIYTRLACALVMLHGGAYKQDSGSWELSRVMLHRRCIQTRQWFMGTEQSKA